MKSNSKKQVIKQIIEKTAIHQQEEKYNFYKKNREETDKNLGKFEQAFNYLKL